MSHKGVGARIAWSIESKRVLKDLSVLLGNHSLELIDFAEGEVRRDAALDHYAKARDRGTLKTSAFSDSASFSEAVHHDLQRWNPSERLTIFLQDSERKGAYDTTQAAVTEHASRVLSYDGSSVFFVSTDCDHGLLLDIEQAPDLPARFELESW